MPELGSYGSVRGARGNSRPYRESRISGRRIESRRTGRWRGLVLMLPMWVLMPVTKLSPSFAQTGAFTRSYNVAFSVSRNRSISAFTGLMTC